MQPSYFSCQILAGLFEVDAGLAVRARLYILDGAQSEILPDCCTCGKNINIYSIVM